MEEVTAAVSQLEKNNQLKLQETVTDMIRKCPENAVLPIRTWLLEMDTGTGAVTEKGKVPKEYTGRRKTAVFLVTVGLDIAAEIFKYLREDEIEPLTFEIAMLDAIEPDRKDAVLQEFYELIMANQFVSTDGIDFARELLEKSLGSQKAVEIINRLTSILQARPFDFIHRTDPAIFLNVIQAEHPQTIALILSYLEREKASIILQNLPHDLQGEVVRRIAIMGRTSPEVLREVERVLEKKLSALSTLSSENYYSGGVDSAVDILNRVDRASEKQIIEALKDEDPELAEEIKRRMFVFEDIVLLDNRSIQKVMRDVAASDLAKALKTVDAEVQNKIFRNMSKRAVSMLKEDMKYMGPVRLIDVEECQQRIVSIIRYLEYTGEIVIVRAGEDMVVSEHLESEFGWNDIPSLSYAKRILLLREVNHETLVTALKLTRRDVFIKLTEPLGFFKRFKLKLDIRKLKDLSVDDVVNAQDEIVAIVNNLDSSETAGKMTDDVKVEILCD